MKISIIIVNYNSTKYIEKLLNSICCFLAEVNYEIIIVDNCSPNRDIEKLSKHYKDVTFLFLGKNYGFGYANNRGMEIAIGDFYLLLNPDAFFYNDSIKLMLKEMENNLNWGIVGPMVRYENGGIQESALHFLNIRYQIYDLFHLLSIVIRNTKKLRRKIFGDREYETDYLFGSCMLIRRELHFQINGFDEDYFLFAEEADYCYKAKFNTKYKIIHFPKSQIKHVAGAITKREPARRIFQNYNSKLIFIIKNYKGIYAILLRYIIIVVFLKKTITQYLFSKENYSLNKDIYRKIILMYFKKKPLINER